MESACKVPRKKHKGIWILLSIILTILIAASLCIGFLYTDYDGLCIAGLGGIYRVRKTFYLFQNQIYCPVTVKTYGKVNIEDVPYYYGKASDQISKVQFEHDPFRGEGIRGDYLGQADGDFLNDTKIGQSIVKFYALEYQNGDVVPDLLWTEQPGKKPYLSAIITKPYTRKMLQIDKWPDYAEDLSILLEVDADMESGIMQPFGNSKYDQTDSNNQWYRFRRNWAFFLRDVKNIFTV